MMIFTRNNIISNDSGLQRSTPASFHFCVIILQSVKSTLKLFPVPAVRRNIFTHEKMVLIFKNVLFGTDHKELLNSRKFTYFHYSSTTDSSCKVYNYLFTYPTFAIISVVTEATWRFLDINGFKEHVQWSLWRIVHGGVVYLTIFVRSLHWHQFVTVNG